jgi:hypothetical protein
MSFLWDAMFIQVLGRTGPVMLDLSGTPYILLRRGILKETHDLLQRIAVIDFSIPQILC